ncbi:MAG: hypothetical protein M1834_006027 [Cirrosporium novae-zelandiae]|nr:MAG: hypothetical protein M1834_006027 [Cirrosporium novae-zelandiae]
MSNFNFNATSDVATASLATHVNTSDRFNFNTTDDEAAAELAGEIKSKTVIITGISPGGLGAEAARAILKQHPKLLILASRRETSIKEVIDKIQKSPDDNVKALELDLSSLTSVRKAAEKVLQMTPVVDVLINNAAVMMTPEYRTTGEGIEWHFGLNHIGHFLFTNLIMPAMLKAPNGACVVNISSAGHRATGVNFDDVNFNGGKSYDKFLGYAQSKTANILFSVGLAQKLGHKNIRSFGIDPGAVAGTNLNRDIPMEELKARGWWGEDGKPNTKIIPFRSVEQGAANYIVAAFDPSIADQSGKCIAACAIDDTAAPHALDKDNAEKLWSLSEKIVGQEFRYD